MKKFCFLPLLMFCAGCLITASDPEAEKAAEVYRELHSALPEKPVSPEAALKMVPGEKAPEVRLAFARLAIGKKEPSSPAWRVQCEKARVELNVLLGFLPADMISYDTAGALDVPPEISHVEAAEMAALIIDNGCSEPLGVLKNVRFAHADAVKAMNDLAVSATAENNLAYVTACIRLASVIGVEPDKLDKLEEYEKRFNAASSRWKKSRESEE